MHAGEKGPDHGLELGGLESRLQPVGAETACIAWPKGMNGSCIRAVPPGSPLCAACQAAGAGYSAPVSTNAVKTFALLPLLAGAALLLSGCATTQPTTAANDNSSAMLTGSYLPQSVNSDGVADGVNNVSVVTAEEIRNSGASTVPRALNRVGYGR